MGNAKISGLGKALPKRIMTNDDLTAYVETSNEWIESRTGIRARHISETETTTELAIKASQEALQNAGIKGDEVGMIIVATISPDYVMPSTACLVQHAIGATEATAFDISAACSGFIYGVKLAVDALKGEVEHVLVVGAEVLSKTVDWQDRTTCVLFGDGAGAAILSKNDSNNIISLSTGSDGEGGMALTLSGRMHDNCLSPKHTTLDSKPQALAMDGREVYKFATTIVPKSILQVISQSAYSIEEVDWFVLHQANTRIIESVAKKLGVPKEKFFTNLATHGNTSSASIPMALYDLKDQLKSGDKIVLSGFGGGLTWGSLLMIWE